MSTSRCPLPEAQKQVLTSRDLDQRHEILAGSQQGHSSGDQ
jgi:hypothetical protein